jgi:hypothetical protein
MIYPVSTTGACPYCQSYDVIYLVLVPTESKDIELPPLLSRLLTKGHALIFPDSGKEEVPSFQCRQCGYGFNLDWTATNLETVFNMTSLEENRPVEQPTGSSDKGQEQQQHLALRAATGT